MALGPTTTKWRYAEFPNSKFGFNVMNLNKCLFAIACIQFHRPTENGRSWLKVVMFLYMITLPSVEVWPFFSHLNRHWPITLWLMDPLVSPQTDYVLKNQWTNEQLILKWKYVSKNFRQLHMKLTISSVESRVWMSVKSSITIQRLGLELQSFYGNWLRFPYILIIVYWFAVADSWRQKIGFINLFRFR